MAKLLPCPFCGLTPAAILGVNGLYGISHDGCLFAFHTRYVFQSPEEALKEWNTRHVQTLPIAGNANKPFLVVREDKQHLTKPYSYFVLDVASDKHAEAALHAYVDSLVNESPKLKEFFELLVQNKKAFELMVRYGLQGQSELSA